MIKFHSGIIFKYQKLQNGHPAIVQKLLGQIYGTVSFQFFAPNFLTQKITESTNNCYFSLGWENEKFRQKFHSYQVS